MNKKQVYVVLFIILGILLGFIAHGIIEIWFTRRLLKDYNRYSLGHSWQTWFSIHLYFSVFLFVLSGLIGYLQGKFWWRVVYQEKRLDPFFKQLRKLLKIF